MTKVFQIIISIYVFSSTDFEASFKTSFKDKFSQTALKHEIVGYISIRFRFSYSLSTFSTALLNFYILSIVAKLFQKKACFSSGGFRFRCIMHKKSFMQNQSSQHQRHVSQFCFLAFALFFKLAMIYKKAMQNELLLIIFSRLHFHILENMKIQIQPK